MIYRKKKGFFVLACDNECTVYNQTFISRLLNLLFVYQVLSDTKLSSKNSDILLTNHN